MDFKLELVAVPVSDVDRAKAFYEQVGFNADHDHVVSDDIRFVQLTPPGSGCSIALGKGVTDMEPGSLRGLQVVVDDINAANARVRELGGEAGDPMPVPSMGWFSLCTDTEGNDFGLWQTDANASMPES